VLIEFCVDEDLRNLDFLRNFVFLGLRPFEGNWLLRFLCVFFAAVFLAL
jgi:hypothetical protein